MITPEQRLDRAKRNYKRATTRHYNEQLKGARDGSVRQTRRMALAVSALSRASFELRDAERAMKWNQDAGSIVQGIKNGCIVTMPTDL